MIASGIISNEAKLLTLLKPEERILDGYESSENQFPFHASIAYTRAVTCALIGGTIISNRFVLTTADPFVGQS